MWYDNFWDLQMFAQWNISRIESSWILNTRCFTTYPNYCVLLIRVTQCKHVLLKITMFTNESSIGCSDIIEHKRLCLVKHYIPIKYLNHCITPNTDTLIGIINVGLRWKCSMKNEDIGCQNSISTHGCILMRVAHRVCSKHYTSIVATEPLITI